MGKIRKIGLLFGLKGILCIACLTTVALALVAYTATVTITRTQQFTIGVKTQAWEVYVNDVDQVRYLPGADTKPPNDASPCAFSVKTTDNKDCAVKIELQTAMNPADFSKFQIRVYYYFGGSWVSAQLYDADLVTLKSAGFIDGLSADSGYIVQQGAGTLNYLVEVTYSYDQPTLTAGDTVTALFDYTPTVQTIP